MEMANQGLLSEKMGFLFPFQECLKGLSNGV
jgi:hypothetical protein